MLDVDAVEDVKVGDVTVRVSSIPAGIAHALGFRETKTLAPLLGHIAKDGSPLPGHEREVEALQLACDSEWLLVARDWLRWGLRSHADRLESESVRFDGREWKVLTAAAVEPMLRAEGGYLALRIAREVAARQRVSKEQALGFLSPSGS